MRIAAYGPHAANVVGLTDQTDLLQITKPPGSTMRPAVNFRCRVVFLLLATRLSDINGRKRSWLKHEEGWCYGNKHRPLVTLLFGLVFLTTVGVARATLTPQQQRMTSCNQQATAQALKGMLVRPT